MARTIALRVVLALWLATTTVAASTGDEVARLDQLSEQAVEFEAAGRTEEASRLFEEALAGYRRLGDLEGQSIVMGNQGALLEALGDYDGALAHFEEAEVAANSAPLPEAAAWAPRRAAIARINQATALEKTSDYAAAFERLRRDLEHPEDLAVAERVGLWTNAGVLVRNLGDPRRALRLFDRAWEDARHGGDLATQANVRLNRALAWWLDLASPEEARVELTAASELARRSDDHAELVQTLFYLGRFELTEGNPIAAEAAFSQALKEAREADNAEGRWSALEGLGRVALAQGQPARAAARFREAAGEIEQTRRRVADRRRRAGYFGDRRGVYEGWIAATLAESGSDPSPEALERALEISEAARARDLMDVWRRADRQSEAAYRFERRADRPASLVFFSVDGRLLRFLLEGHSIGVADRGGAEELRQMADRVVRSWSQGGSSSEEDLLADRLLGDLPARDRWQVVLESAFSSLPIDALPGPVRQPWFESSTVTLWPSVAAIDRLARMAQANQAARSPRALRYVGLGAPSVSGLAALPASEVEIQSARLRFQPLEAAWVGASATEAALRAVESVDLLHLATHAVHRGGETALALSPSGGDNGWLQASEIAALRIDVGTVLLSACRAGGAGGSRGAALSGATLSGLTSAFLAAGARGVIAPLWDVQDSDAAAISDQLTARLARGEDPAVALREVKRTLRANPRWNSPDRWAAWVAIGAPEAPGPGQDWRSGGLWAIAGLGLVGLGWLAWLALSGKTGRRPRS